MSTDQIPYRFPDGSAPCPRSELAMDLILDIVQGVGQLGKGKGR